MREGPDHYTKLSPEPIDVIRAWELPWCIGNVVKYCARYRNKNGLEDLKKARHYLDMEIEALSRLTESRNGGRDPEWRQCCAKQTLAPDWFMFCVRRAGHDGRHSWESESGSSSS